MNIANDSFLKACRNEKPDHIPVWFMRQAGRYQPEYREIRKKYSLVEICKHPEVCAEVTCLPVEQLNVDAAILFSDIMMPLEQLGIEFEIKENVGPVISNPIISKENILKLKQSDSAKNMQYAGEAIRQIVNSISVPLIGFSGAPFTLASYCIEGGPSKNFIKTKTMMYNHSDDFFALLDHLADAMIDYLNYQIDSGCSAFQLFDSWAGNVTAEDYEKYILRHSKKIFDALRKRNVPMIHFAVNSEHLLSPMKKAGSTVLGIDWKTDLAKASKQLNYEVALQGNLDPALLFADENILHQKVKQILESVNFDGFIFNLGHGVLPRTDGKQLKKIVEMVHSHKAI
jgi:uroporphyrinogen decarboxylase